MRLHIAVHACAAGQTLPLLPHRVARESDIAAHALIAPAWPDLFGLGVGATLRAPDGEARTPLFRVSGRAWLPLAPLSPQAQPAPPALSAILLTALAEVAAAPDGESRALECAKNGWAAAWVTLSDKASRGERADEAGPAIRGMLESALPLCGCQGYLIPDEAPVLRALLTDLALHQGYDLVCTTGGTGLSARDVTPQVTQTLLDMPLPGFSQAMLAASLAATPHAAISRGVAGVLGKCLILNLPGSPRAVRENLAAVLPALGHALDKLHGDASDCARPDQPAGGA